MKGWFVPPIVIPVLIDASFVGGELRGVVSFRAFL